MNLSENAQPIAEIQTELSRSKYSLLTKLCYNVLEL